MSYSTFLRLLLCLLFFSTSCFAQVLPYAPRNYMNQAGFYNNQQNRGMPTQRGNQDFYSQQNYQQNQQMLYQQYPEAAYYDATVCAGTLTDQCITFVCNYSEERDCQEKCARGARAKCELQMQTQSQIQAR